MQMQYLKWGYTFRPEKMECGSWRVVGHKSGVPPYALDKLGTSASEQEMQRKLISWSRHVLAEPVMKKAAVMSPEGKAIELELFPQRVGCVV